MSSVVGADCGRFVFRFSAQMSPPAPLWRARGPEEFDPNINDGMTNSIIRTMQDIKIEDPSYFHLESVSDITEQWTLKQNVVRAILLITV
jgi:hypothetical protein